MHVKKARLAAGVTDTCNLHGLQRQTQKCKILPQKYSRKLQQLKSRAHPNLHMLLTKPCNSWWPHRSFTIDLLYKCEIFARPCMASATKRSVAHKSSTQRQPRHSTGYSAGDDPQHRKHPELYGSLQTQAPPDAASAAQKVTPLHVPAQTHGSTQQDEPSISFMISSISSSSSSGSGSVPLPGGLACKPEVLAPAGGWPQLKAACENGADAVYFGVSDFNARARAANFTPKELPDVMRYLHERNVKGYVALNVLVFDEELARVEQRVREMALAGVDAVIVQDLGVVELIRQVAPNLPVHGSTQMSITSPEGADFVQRMGVERVVVGRELSVKEIAKVRTGTSAEVEAFVHGALCVSYSGQCFSSEAWGGRSANRGQCAQACRMPYGLLVDGVLKEMGDKRYLLSPQDLMAVEQVPELIQAGVSCFKIEGRLKGPEYVALTTQVYRRAVDAAWEALHDQLAAAGHDADGNEQRQEHAANEAAGSTHGAAVAAAPAGGVKGADVALQQAKQAVRLTEQQRWDLEQVFARGQDGEYRGLTPGFLEGVQHQRLIRGRAPRHRGVYLGRVSQVTPRGVVLELQAPLKRGDGVVFDCGMPESEEEGGAVFDLQDRRGRSLQGTIEPPSAVQVVFGQGQVDLRHVRVGDLVWRTKDHALESRLRSSYEALSSAQARKVPVEVAVSGSLGQPLLLTLRDSQGHTASAVTEVALSAAAKRPLTAEDIMRGIGQLGDNSLEARHVDLSQLHLDQGLFLPASDIKSMRRKAVDALLQQRQQHQRAQGLAPEPVLSRLLAAARTRTHEQTLPATAAAAPAAAATAAAAASMSAASAADASPAGPLTPSTSSTSLAAVRQRSTTKQLAAAARIRVLCRTRQQVEAAVRLPWLEEVVLDFLEVQGLKEAVVSVKAAGRRAVVATPRVLKPDEERLWIFYLRLNADALLIRSSGFLHQMMCLGGAGATVPGHNLRIPVLEGDFSLNAANCLTADLLLSAGLERLAPTHDLNAMQLCVLAHGVAARSHMLEAIVHQHLPIFHTEACVFCRFLSSGNSYKDCGHPCETSTVHLRDSEGKDHLVLADMGCRNTVFNAKAQSGLYYIPKLLRAGYTNFRIELVDEPAHLVKPLLNGYREVMLGSRPPSELWSWLGSSLLDANGRAGGVATGSLEVVKERAAASLRPTAAVLKR